MVSALRLHFRDSRSKITYFGTNVPWIILVLSAVKRLGTNLMAETSCFSSRLVFDISLSGSLWVQKLIFKVRKNLMFHTVVKEGVESKIQVTFSTGQSTGHHDTDKWIVLKVPPSPNLSTKCSLDLGKSVRFGNLSMEQWLLTCWMWCFSSTVMWLVSKELFELQILAECL